MTTCIFEPLLFPLKPVVHVSLMLLILTVFLGHHGIQYNILLYLSVTENKGHMCRHMYMELCSPATWEAEVQR